jgi:hypothetical protein
MDAESLGDLALLERVMDAIREQGTNPVLIHGVLFHVRVDRDLPEDTLIVYNGVNQAVIVTGVKN